MKANYLLIPIFTLLVATVGSFITEAGLKRWYKNLKLPPFTPPGNMFGLIWTAIYVVTAIALLLIWNSGSFLDQELWFLAVLFMANAAINLFWSYLFFYLHMLGYAVLDCIALVISILGIMIYVLPLAPGAAYLLLPYLAWVGFAAYLSYQVWLLNRKRT